MNKHFQPILERLNQRETLQPLLPATDWDPALKAQIEALDWGSRRKETSVIALMAGLHLLNDSLDASHSYAQQIEYDATGAYWHGLMHRMEADYFNSKYWFNQAGPHPVKEAVKQKVASWLRAEADLDALPPSRARDILRTFKEGAGWSPSPFVDLIAWQANQSESNGIRPLLEQIQRFEMAELFDHTLAAVSTS